MPLLNLNPNTQPISATTQDHLDIEDVQDDLVILKNGNVCLVLETTAVNFDLLSEPEQDAKIMAFAGLLNSLNFHIQILIRTHRVDITNYIRLLEEHRNKQISDALKRQIAIYIEFVKNLIVRNEVLDKRFYIVIPFMAAYVDKTSALKQLFGKKSKITNVSQIMVQAKTNLHPKRDHIIKQLKRMGIDAYQLSSDRLINLFYEIYNPRSAKIQKTELDIEKYKSTFVEKGGEEPPEEEAPPSEIHDTPKPTKEK